MKPDNKSRLTLYGNVVLGTPTDVLTVQDVYDFLETLKAMGVPNTNPLLDGYLTYEYQTTSVGVSKCGDDPAKFDWLLKAHDCDRNQ